ncbi:MAG: lysophospholipid acyltransferase family protein [Colwellia sp.]
MTLKVILHKVNYIWRVIATGLCFTIFGVGALFLSLLVFPIQALVVHQDKKRKKLARLTVHYTFKFFIGLMSFTRIFTFKLEQATELANIKSQLVLANHPSLIDVAVLISMIPNADCVVKAHLFKNPFLRGVVKSIGYISNSDPEGLLKDCAQTLKEGNNLIIFPEGTRSQPGEPLKFQRGAANIALRCLPPNHSIQNNFITTVILDVTPTTLTKSDIWYKVPERKVTFSAKVVDNKFIIPQVDTENTSKEVRTFNQTLNRFFTSLLAPVNLNK